MGGLVGSIFDLAEGDPTSSEQHGLGDLSGFENNAGEGAVNAGLGFNNAILSGNPEAIAQVEAPEIKGQQDQIQQAAQQASIFGNRGGGGNASAQGAQSAARGNIINLTGSLQQGAAASDLGAGQNLLGQGATNLNSEAGLAAANQQRQTSDVGGIAQGVGEIATGLMNPAAAAGELSPGTESNPDIANYLSNNGPEPGGSIDASGLDNSAPDMSVFQ